MKWFKYLVIFLLITVPAYGITVVILGGGTSGPTYKYLGSDAQPADKDGATADNYTWIFDEANTFAGYIIKIEAYVSDTGGGTMDFAVFSKSGSDFTDAHYVSGLSISAGLNTWTHADGDFDASDLPIAVGEYIGFYANATGNLDRWHSGGPGPGYYYDSGDQIGDAGASTFSLSSYSEREIQIRVYISSEDPEDVSNPCADMGASGTYKFWLNCDYSGDTDKACVNSGASTKDGTINGATIDTWTNFGISGPTNGGTYGIKLDSADEYISYAISSGDIINTSEGTIALDIYRTTSNNTITYAQCGTGDDEITATVGSNDTLYTKHKGDANVVSFTTTGSISLSTWTVIRIAWSVTSNEVAVKIGGSSWETDSDADTVTAFSSAATALEIGDGPSGNGLGDTFYIDNFRVSSTYKDESL